MWGTVALAAARGYALPMTSPSHDPAPAEALSLATPADAAPEPLLGRALRWPATSTIAFGAMLSGLLALGIAGIVEPVRHPAGLPDDPDVRAARELLTAGLPLQVPVLLLPNALSGGSVTAADTGTPFGPLAAARAHLSAAAGRHPRDARLDAALGHVSLAALRIDDALAAYRAALGRERHYGEARLGLGVALATRAWLAPTAEERRLLTLEALGQIANVERGDPVYEAALFDRAHLLGQVGRGAEGRKLLEAELAVRPSGPWVRRYRVLLGAL